MAKVIVEEPSVKKSCAPPMAQQGASLQVKGNSWTSWPSGPFLCHKRGSAMLPRRTRAALLTRQAAPLVILAMLLLIIDYYTFSYLRGMRDVQSSHDQSIADIWTLLGDQQNQIGDISHRIDAFADNGVSVTNRLNYLYKRMGLGRQATELLAERLGRLEEEAGAWKLVAATSANRESRANKSLVLLSDYQFDKTIPLVANAVIHRTKGEAD